MAQEVVLQTNLPLPLFGRGKVRDTYDLGDQLLVVATDRISAFDAIMPNGIPDKGRVLTLLSAFWFGRTREIIPNHLISIEAGDLPESLGATAQVVSCWCARRSGWTSSVWCVAI
jgi:phosphoribosylaminoimidazole-succinocarboxamide synthase